jgi:S1-C subfamily serine protease
LSARVRVLSGGRTGVIRNITADALTIGRQADAQLQLDPAGDLEVSARHAIIGRVGDGWQVRDLGSRNGTFVNGQRITADTPLRDGDRIRLGVQGPVLEFLLKDEQEATAEALAEATMPAESPTAAVRRQVHQQTRRLRYVVAGLVVLLLLTAAVLVALNRRQRRAFEQERNAFRARVDSVLANSNSSIRMLRGQLGGLADALRGSQDQIRTLQAQLDRAQSAGRTDEVSSLRRQLQSATVALARQQLAASLDFSGIKASNERAVAMIFVQYDDGEVVSGTAFAVRVDGTLLTNRHVVIGPDGKRRPTRIGVQFSGSRQVWPARLVATDTSADLAAVKVDNIVGAVPVVKGIDMRADTMGPGTPVALIGFPLGGETANRPNSATPLLTAGVVTAWTSDGLEVSGYGAAGASGSPIFGADGELVGVLYGGRKEDAERVLLGVPAASVARLLSALP